MMYVAHSSFSFKLSMYFHLLPPVAAKGVGGAEAPPEYAQANVPPVIRSHVVRK